MIASRLTAVAAALLLLLLPTTVFWAVEPPVAADVLPLYVTRGVYLTDLPLFLLLLTAVVTDRLRLRRLPWLIPLFLIAALGVLTAVPALSPAFALYNAARWLLAALLALWFAGSGRPRRWITLFLIGLGLQALVGLGQVLVEAPLGLPGELALPPAVSGAAIVDVGGLRWLRAYGLTFHPNVLGGYMAAGLLLGLPLLTDRRVWPLWWLLWLGLFLSFSRSAWVATAVTLPVVIAALYVQRPTRRRSLLRASGGAVFILLLASFIWRAQLATRLAPLLPATAVTQPTPTPLFENISLVERAELNVIAREIITDRPLLGVGAGNFPLALIERGDRIRIQFVHNITLLLGAEVGAAGGALWLLLGGIGLLALAAGWRAADPWRLAAAGAWLALFLISFFDSYPWALSTGQLLTAFTLGLSAVGDQGQDDSQ